MQRLQMIRPAILMIMAMAAVAIDTVTFASIAQARVSELTLNQVQERCIKAAEAKGFTVDSVVSREINHALDGEPSRATVSVILALAKAGYSYTVTCPLTISYSSINEVRVVSNTGTTTPPSSDPQTDAKNSHQFLAGGWFLLPLLALLMLLWLFTRKRDAQPLSSSSTRHEPIQTLGLLTDSKSEFSKETATSQALESPPRPSEPLLSENLSRDVSMEDRELKPQEPTPPVDEKVLSVIQEELAIATQQVARNKVQVHKRVETREEVVDAPTVHERVVVEYIPVNQVIDGEVPAERDEGDVHIIPLFEEVAVAETRLFLREEVHITKQRIVGTERQTVNLRCEIADVERTTTEQASEQVNQQVNQPIAIANLATSAHQPVALSEQPASELKGEQEKLEAAIAPPAYSESTPSRSTNALETDQEIVIPIVAEEVTLATQKVIRGKVQVHTRVETRPHVVDTPVMQEQVLIEHIPINQFVEGTVPTEREEGGIRIIPILEEVVVHKTQLLLREEIRISKQRTTEMIPQAVTLRREVVDIEQS